MPGARRFRSLALTAILALVALLPAAAHAQNYSDIWWNPSESGWGLTIADHETQLFAVLYTYREDGAPVWFVIPGGTFSQGRRIFTGDIYRTTGPSYDVPFDANLVTRTRVGTATIDFSPPGFTAGQALFIYSIGSITRSKAIQRQSFGNAMPNWGTDLTDIWWDPAESGWGLTLAQHGNNIFGVWFTYGVDGQPLWVVMPGAAFQGPMSFSGDLYTTTGPYYGNPTFDASQVRLYREGSASISFQAITSSLKQFVPRRGQWSGVFRNSVQFKTLAAQPFGNSAPSVSAPLAIQVPALPNATAGTFYSQRAATASGGSPPYSFSLDSFVNGTPPLGTIIDLGGFLTGTPSSTYTSLRTFSFRICVSDLTRATVCAPASVTVTPATPARTGTMQWTVGNQCNNGQSVQLKWYDRDNDWVWPSATTHYPISFGQSFTYTLDCFPGGLVCLGARSSSGTLSWGVGFAGTGGCSNCCGTCGAGNYDYSFGCSGSTPPGGTFYYANWSCNGSGQCASVMGGPYGSKGPFCSISACQSWGSTYIPFGYSCSTQPTYTPSPGGSQCNN